MDDVLAFRNAMAEAGHEYTPSAAANALRAVETFRREIHRQAREEPEKFELLANLSLKDKQQLCLEAAQQGVELTIKEVEQLAQITLEAYEQEKPF